MIIGKELRNLLGDLNVDEIMGHVENDTIEYFLISWKDEFERRLEKELEMAIFKRLSLGNKNFITYYVNTQTGNIFESYAEVIEDCEKRYGNRCYIAEYYTVRSEEV